MSAFETAAIARLVARAEAAGVEVPDRVRAAAAGVLCGTGMTGARLFAEAHPDADPAGCCVGEAIRGLDHCTCWEAVYDVDQADPDPGYLQTDGLAVRPARCGDCAYRVDSPERADTWTADHLTELAISGEPFWCHDGMRQPSQWVHPQRGVIDGSTADWRPPIVGGVPFRADGRPGLLCAGWAAEGRRQERRAARENW